ncbi:hypothetical protein F4861DRAFT_535154 [Xylaria intraflava]|nr:hypothetical protein F4861DRAFT_535154 [Xylaria intraflava]
MAELVSIIELQDRTNAYSPSDNGHSKSRKKKREYRLQTPSNVTRISRCFRRKCSDGTFQIIYYQSGVGSRSGVLDRIFGGAFGIGISENIREAYAFICANYVDGDDIILLGFSRGAFTARSIGGMISDLGLLTREGMEYFYPIFKDMQNWSNDRYDDPFPKIPFTNKPKGADAASIYRQRLIKKGYTRVKWNEDQDTLISVLAIGVWDTVGSLGIPDFYNTHLSNKIQHGFHALALDETRGMMDQLSSVGCEFKTNAIKKLCDASIEYYVNQELERILVKRRHSRHRKQKNWAEKSILESNRPIRPWGLHSIQSVTGPLYNLIGSVTRAPGMYHKIDPKNGRPLPEFLEDTNERIHPSVRVRLACEGLGLNDTHVWCCPSLLKYWRPRRVSQRFSEPTLRTAEGESAGLERQSLAAALLPEEQRETADEVDTLEESLQMLTQNPSDPWVWEYIGPKDSAPGVTAMVEENLGPFERQLLKLAAGKIHVLKYSERQNAKEFRVFHLWRFRRIMKRSRRKHRKAKKARDKKKEKKDKRKDKKKKR